ncbi:MAG: hypothetical protein HUU60_07890 [Armatimonadetes bacterium]|nr:hypothetical protein [Armatimonadota bacterium]
MAGRLIIRIDLDAPNVEGLPSLADPCQSIAYLRRLADIGAESKNDLQASATLESMQAFHGAIRTLYDFGLPIEPLLPGRDRPGAELGEILRYMKEQGFVPSGACAAFGSLQPPSDETIRNFQLRWLSSENHGLTPTAPVDAAYFHANGLGPAQASAFLLSLVESLKDETNLIWLHCPIMAVADPRGEILRTLLGETERQGLTYLTFREHCGLPPLYQD